LDIAVPTRIVSEEPMLALVRMVSCGLPNPRGFLLPLRSTGGSQGVPAYGVVHSMSSRSNLPHRGSYKADALSSELRGHTVRGAQDVSMPPALSINSDGTKLE
jgi:hypothetical protein